MKKIIFSLITLFTLSLSAQIDRMEPPFWYEGMNKSEVQILFYGKNIAQNSVQISNNVVITNVTKTENPNYLFVTIDTKNVKAQELQFTFTNVKNLSKEISKSKREDPIRRFVKVLMLLM